VGQAIACALAGPGARIGVHYRSSDTGARETARRIEQAGGNAELFQADITDRSAARALVDDCVRRFGGLDLLVLSAANFERIEFADLDDDAWDRSLGLNAASQFALAHQAAPALRQSRGNIVLITCSSTQTPMRNYLPYVVSKAATKQLMRALALELAPEVRVNAVAPGTVLPPPGTSDAVRDALTARIPLQRIGSAEDIAQAVVFLARSSFVTGHELVVDGGRSVAGFERFG
jgi:pteridine reductase